MFIHTLKKKKKNAGLFQPLDQPNRLFKLRIKPNG